MCCCQELDSGVGVGRKLLRFDTTAAPSSSPSSSPAASSMDDDDTNEDCNGKGGTAPFMVMLFFNDDFLGFFTLVIPPADEDKAEVDICGDENAVEVEEDDKTPPCDPTLPGMLVAEDVPSMPPPVALPVSSSPPPPPPSSSSSPYST